MFGTADISRFAGNARGNLSGWPGTDSTSLSSLVPHVVATSITVNGTSRYATGNDHGGKEHARLFVAVWRWNGQAAPDAA